MKKLLVVVLSLLFAQQAVAVDEQIKNLAEALVKLKAKLEQLPSSGDQPPPPPPRDEEPKIEPEPVKWKWHEEVVLQSFRDLPDEKIDQGVIDNARSNLQAIEISTSQSKPFTSAEIEEYRKLINEREQKLHAHETPSPTPATGGGAHIPPPPPIPSTGGGVPKPSQPAAVKKEKPAVKIEPVVSPAVTSATVAEPTSGPVLSGLKAHVKFVKEPVTLEEHRLLVVQNVADLKSVNSKNEVLKRQLNKWVDLELEQNPKWDPTSQEAALLRIFDINVDEVKEFSDAK